MQKNWAKVTYNTYGSSNSKTANFQPTQIWEIVNLNN